MNWNNRLFGKKYRAIISYIRIRRDNTKSIYFLCRLDINHCVAIVRPERFVRFVSKRKM